MNRRRNSSIAGSPMLIGAVTALIAIVGVYLSYNANNGLPFVPTYNVTVRLADASALIRGNEVRLGGARVGVVSKISTFQQPNGAVGSEIDLKLDKKIEPLPADTVAVIRPRSPLGLKYVELTRGDSAQPLRAGGLIDSTAATPPIEIDDFFNMFDEPTREANVKNLNEFGNAFAGRGQALNEFFSRLEPLVAKVEPVMRNLMDERTGWARFFPALEQAAAEVAPVAAQQGELWAALDETFTAWAAVAPEVQETISEGPESLDTAIRELPAQAAFVTESAELFEKFTPAFRHLAKASVNLAPAFRAGEPALRHAVDLNDRVEQTLAALQEFGTDERVIPGLARLTETAELLDPPLAFATPAQTECNYLALFFRNLSSALSESDAVGSFLRFDLRALPQLPDSEAGPASAPANGPAVPQTSRESALMIDSFLHSNPNPNTAAPGQELECEGANEEYVPAQQVIGNQPGNQTLAHEKTRRREAK